MQVFLADGTVVEMSSSATWASRSWQKPQVYKSPQIYSIHPHGMVLWTFAVEVALACACVSVCSLRCMYMYEK